MSAHEYHCSVCLGCFYTRREWLSHLLEGNHQTKARKEICSWAQLERDSVLVVFATFPIASLEFLQFFSNGSSNLVTDFVWFESRPKLGFIQFESKHKVAEIFSGFGSPEIRMNNQLLQIKKAGECLRLEWQQLIPSPFHDELLEAANVNDEEATPPPPPDLIASTFNHMSSQESSNAEDVPFEDVHAVSRGQNSEAAQHLINDYNSICKMMEISDKEYETALQLTEELQTLLAKKFPACKLIWFRNWFLKLKNPSPLNELVFFLDVKGMYGKSLTDHDNNSDSNNFSQGKKGFINHLLLDHCKTLAIRKMTKQICHELFADESLLSFQCRKYELLFSIVKQPNVVLPELQACRLLLYMCSFDPRVKPMLTVIRYWAKVNDIRLAKPGIVPVCRAPDPAALDWLVILFLCHKKKILPPTREITERPHSKLIFKSADIGFAEDTDFAQQFSSRYHEPNEETHALNIFTLAQQFFKFYGAELLLSERKLVLNMKDGEITPMEQFVGKISKIETKLRRIEIKMARKGKKRNPPNVIFIHPLYIQHGFAFCDKSFVTSVCPAMEITGKKLKRALDKVKSGQKVEDMKSAFKVN